MLGLVKGHLLNRSFERQRNSRARDLSLWDLGVTASGHLSIGGVDALDLLDEFGSPLMVVHRGALVRHAREIMGALKVAPAGSQVLYSYKTNCIPGILSELHAVGLGAEVISPYELWLADHLGVGGNHVIYNGVDKTDESLDLAVRMNVAAINVDHQSEIERIVRVARRRGQRARVGIRLGLVQKAQFGLGVEDGESMEACRRILAHRDVLDLQCIHFNVTSNSKNSAEHRRALVPALRFLADLKATLNIEVPLLDIGGGFGVPTTKNMSSVEYLLYRGLGVTPEPPDPAAFQPIDQCMRDLVGDVRQGTERSGIRPPAIAVEPGRFVTSRAELLLTTVKTVKQRAGGIPIAITDAGRLSVTFPCDFEYHEVFVAGRPDAPVETPYMVTGRVCTSADWLVRNRMLPTLQAGDALAVMDAGAYFSSYSSNFAFPRPAIVMVRDGQPSVIRSAESFDHLIAMDRLHVASGAEETAEHQETRSL
jgi:diaminopimelate decarboxylase